MSNSTTSRRRNFSNLETDHHLVLPVESAVRVVTTSEDVLHSWAVPRLGIKIDVIPGRLNSLNIATKLTGLFLGQCSEICGVNHAFMPICVEAIPVGQFKDWVFSFNRAAV